MTAKLIDGKKIAEQILAEVVAEVKDLKTKGVTPGLAAVLIGDNPASEVYVRNKTRTCGEVGIFSETIRLPKEASEKEALALVAKLNTDARFHGILVQLPLPKQINEAKVIMAVSPEKDVDGFHPVSLGRLVMGEPGFMPCTPAGIQQLLVRSGYTPEGKHVVILGRSNIVGKPAAIILMQKKTGANATVTICHTKTRNLPIITRMADILIVAAGSPKAVTDDMVREGAVVIDVGMNRIPDATTKTGTRLVGDVDFEPVKKKAEAITPVPGGVGPMTIAMLLSNTVRSARMAAQTAAAR